MRACSAPCSTMSTSRAATITITRATTRLTDISTTPTSSPTCPPELVPGVPMPDRGKPDPVLSVIVVNWNTRDLLRACLVSVQRHLEALPYEIIVVDNASSDGSSAMVEDEFP